MSESCRSWYLGLLPNGWYEPHPPKCFRSIPFKGAKPCIMSYREAMLHLWGGPPGPISRNVAEEEFMYALPNPAAPIRALVISPDQRLSLHFEQVCNDLQNLKLMRVVSRYPAQQEFVRLLRIYVPQVIFVSVENIPTLTDLIEWVRTEAPGVRVIGIHSFCDSQLLLEVMRIGIQEFLYAPFDKAQLAACLSRVQLVPVRQPGLIARHRTAVFVPARKTRSRHHHPGGQHRHRPRQGR